MSSGEVKKICIEIVTAILEKHQHSRQLIDNEILSKFMSIRSLI